MTLIKVPPGVLVSALRDAIAHERPVCDSYRLDDEQEVEHGSE